jgi:hypothetical protein
MDPRVSEPGKAALACPACRTLSGVPYRAGSILGKPDLVRLGLRCPECRREWEVDVRPEALRNPLKFT